MEWTSLVTPRHVALVCHPHPLFGGTMHNKVVFRAAKAALLLGLPTLRFNFRGAGHSVGTFTGGDGEREDVRAALDYLGVRFPGLPVCLMGFSFGSWVGLAVGATDRRVSTLVGLGLPVSTGNFDFLREVPKPKLILQGTLDEFGSVAQVLELYRSLAEPKQIHWVEGADHFFAGKLDEVQEVLLQFLTPIVSPV
jgi:alpha/beta superfamily hydrolase